MYACSCVCLCLCRNVCVRVCTHTFACMRRPVNLVCCFSGTPSLFFEAGSLTHWDLRLQVRLEKLGSDPQGSSCLCIFRIGVASM